MTLAPLVSPHGRNLGLFPRYGTRQRTGNVLCFGQFLWDRTTRCLAGADGVLLLDTDLKRGSTHLGVYASPYLPEWSPTGGLALAMRLPSPGGVWSAVSIIPGEPEPRQVLGAVSASLLGFRQSRIPSPVRHVGGDVGCWLEPTQDATNPGVSASRTRTGTSTLWPEWFLTEVLRECSVILRAAHRDRSTALDSPVRGVVTDLFTDPRARGVVFVGLCRSVQELSQLFTSNSVNLYRLDLTSHHLRPLGPHPRARLHHRWVENRILVAQSSIGASRTTLVDVCATDTVWHVKGRLATSDGVPGRVGSWTCLDFPGQLFNSDAPPLSLQRNWRLIVPAQQGLDVSVLKSGNGSLGYLALGAQSIVDTTTDHLAPVSLSPDLVRWPTESPRSQTRSRDGYPTIRQSCFDPGAWGTTCALRAAQTYPTSGIPLVWVTTTGLDLAPRQGTVWSPPGAAQQTRTLQLDDIHWRHAQSRPVYEVIMPRPRWAERATFHNYLDGITECVLTVLRHHGISDYILGGYSFGASLVGIAVMLGRLNPQHVVLRSGSYDRGLSPAGFQWEHRDLANAVDVYHGFTLLGKVPAVETTWTIEHGYNDTNAGTPWSAARAFWEGLRGAGANCQFVTGHGVGHSWNDDNIKSQVTAAETAAFNKLCPAVLPIAN